MFADVPIYMYKHFRNNDSIINLSKSFSEKEIITEFNIYINKVSMEVKDTIVAYGILVGVTYLPYDDAIRIFNVLDLNKLEWGEFVRDYYINSYKPLTSVNIEAQIYNSLISHTTSSKTDIKPKPKITMREI